MYSDLKSKIKSLILTWIRYHKENSIKDKVNYKHVETKKKIMIYKV